MTTLKQIEANRLNAQHSTRPVTIEGKAKASQNTLKHGLFAKSNLVQGELEKGVQSLCKRIFGIC